jgi:hypothetical protein
MGAVTAMHVTAVAAGQSRLYDVLVWGSLTGIMYYLSPLPDLNSPGGSTSNGCH